MVRDRLSWMRFCDLGPGDRVPDVNTLRDFREALIKARALDKLFTRLNVAITRAGYLPMGGEIVDAGLIAAPKPRNSNDNKNAIKSGKSAFEIWPLNRTRRDNKAGTHVGPSNRARRPCQDQTEGTRPRFLFHSSGTRITSALTGASGSAGPARSRMQPPMMEHDYAKD